MENPRKKFRGFLFMLKAGLKIYLIVCLRQRRFFTVAALISAPCISTILNHNLPTILPRYSPCR